MKKIIKLLLCLVLFVEMTACAADPETMKPEKLASEITKIITDEKTDKVEKAIKLLPYLVDQAVIWDTGSKGIAITDDEYVGYLEEGIGYIENIIAGEGLSEEEYPLFTKQVAEMITGKISENKVTLYGYIFVKTAENLADVELADNPDENIDKLSEEMIKDILQTGKTYAQISDKLRSNEALSKAFNNVVEKKDPLGTVAMLVEKHASDNTVVFPNSLLKKLADNQLKILSYAKFFTKTDRENFFGCFPTEGDFALTLFLLGVKLNGNKDNLNIYAKASPLAKNIADLEVSSDFKTIYEEYNQYCIDNDIADSKEALIKKFPLFNYSGIAQSTLLSPPVEPIDGTFIMSISKSGNNTFNDRNGSFYAVDKYVRNETTLRVAPLEYAKYLIVATYKHTKTRYYYTKVKNRVYKLSGTLTIYDRTNGKELAKIPFSSKKPPKKIYRYDMAFYRWPSIERAKDSFYKDFSKALKDLK